MTAKERAQQVILALAREMYIRNPGMSVEQAVERAGKFYRQGIELVNMRLMEDSHE